jgi:two-component system chemotaxis response regulator CheY
MQRVLDVGQCNPDHAAIRRLIEDNFEAVIDRADGLDETLAALDKGPVALVLVNRKLDADYSDGLDIIRHIKADERLAETPMMLVTNYPEHQETAVAAGAVLGFGKQELAKPETFEKLGRFLKRKS